jgi:hypothetical protein
MKDVKKKTPSIVEALANLPPIGKWLTPEEKRALKRPCPQQTSSDSGTIYKKWTMQKINELTEEYSTFERKGGKLSMGEGLIIAGTLMMGDIENKNLNINEITDLVLTFNGCHHNKDAIKRYLVMETLFFAKRILRLIFNGHSHNIYKSPPITLPPTNDYFEKKKGINKAQIYGLFETSYIGIPRITGKISTGLCKCCSNHEVDKIEIQKIVNIISISKLNLRASAMGYELVVTATNK